MPYLPPKQRRSWEPKRQGRAFRNPWYNSRRWRTIAFNHKAKHPLCVLCYPKIVQAYVADHIEPVSRGRTDQEREQRMWYGELQSLCRKCHDSKSAKEKI